MVKIRGHRDDMLHVEDVVRSQPSVKQAVVVDVRSTDGDAGLVAFVVPAPAPRSMLGCCGVRFARSSRMR
ncbi:MAG TPA: hypothetical protein VKV24_14455 [Casimicrobiaceae bacterium]|nr:hypothetical protein [Casimicrobiaceae bacterium]